MHEVRSTRSTPSYAAALRQDLSTRAIVWAEATGAAHEQTIGQSPAVVFREDLDGRHPNFFPASYRRIRSRPEWKRRLNKVHTTAHRCLVSHDENCRELDTAVSSDALLMSVFCCSQPSGSGNASLSRLLGTDLRSSMRFGHKPRIPLRNGGFDQTEVDLHVGDLYIEAKLTESDFQTAPRRRLEMYRDAGEVFSLEVLLGTEARVFSYQLIRGALAAYAEPGRRYCVICDARRPDLIEAWFSVMRAVRCFELKTRLQIITWQELSATLPGALQRWLGNKYGIYPTTHNPGIQIA